MPKVKTHSGAAKRFKVSGSGKLIFRRTNKRHLLRKRSTKQKRHLSIDGVVKMCDFKRLRNALRLRNRKVRSVSVSNP